jgi:uncharacterized protein YbaR (Trm112 family)
MIRCPLCRGKVKFEFRGDLEATMWNFDGDSADIEINMYCHSCEEPFKIQMPATIRLDFEESRYV